MALRFLILRILFVISFAVVSLLFYVFDDGAWKFWWIYTILLDLFLGIKIAWDAICLLYLMKKYHALEYNTHKWSIFSMALLSTLVLVWKTYSLAADLDDYTKSASSMLGFNANDF